jgi:hypothetical protein
MGKREASHHSAAIVGCSDLPLIRNLNRPRASAKEQVVSVSRICEDLIGWNNSPDKCLANDNC